MKTVTIKKDGTSIKIQSIGYCDLITSCLIDGKLLDTKIFPYSHDDLDGIERAKNRQIELQGVDLCSKPIMMIDLRNVTIIEEKENEKKEEEIKESEKEKINWITDLTVNQIREFTYQNPILKKQFDLITNMTYVVITYSNKKQEKVPYWLFEKRMEQYNILIDSLNWV